ncbi:MAG TPA: enoyl-CoA hydratase/isomerase family protein [Amycolatopsis sp.]|nr:enoyl-CoA hydratase/isomerase family protein [Amycolatopsis sp.]
MTGDCLLVEDHGDGVRVLTLNRPERLNALDGELVHRLIAELDRAAGRHPDVRVLVLRGAGTSFCPGADLKWAGGLRDRGAHAAFQDSLNSLCTKLSTAPQAVIAAVHGYALAGGLETALACDIVVTAADASLGDEHINRPILPGAGGSQRLPRKIGQSRGLFYLLTGRRMTGAEAAQFGLAAFSVPRPELDAATLGLAREVAGKDGHAIDLMKQAVRRGLELPLTDALSLELFLQSRFRARAHA